MKHRCEKVLKCGFGGVIVIDEGGKAIAPDGRRRLLWVGCYLRNSLAAAGAK